MTVEDKLREAEERYNQLAMACELETRGEKSRIFGEVKRLLDHELGEIKILLKGHVDPDAKFILTSVENIERGMRRISRELESPSTHRYTE